MLEAYAPYLVRLPGDSRLLETLVAQGWGKHWGIFVVSAADFKTLRKHFRTFLMVKSPEGKRLYFRYYDPRVLRVYLPTCNAEETNFVFGPVAAYLCEGESPDTLLVFQPGQDSAQCEAVKLSGTRRDHRYINQCRESGRCIPESSAVRLIRSAELRTTLCFKSANKNKW